MIYKYICSDTKIKGIPDETVYLNDIQIKYYRIYYTERPFFLNFICCCIPKCMFRSDYIFQIGVPA
jgi:hypothetical protein